MWRGKVMGKSKDPGWVDMSLGVGVKAKSE